MLTDANETRRTPHSSGEYKVMSVRADVALTN
jgi:hypothetical protein